MARFSPERHRACARSTSTHMQLRLSITAWSARQKWTRSAWRVRLHLAVGHDHVPTQALRSILAPFFSQQKGYTVFYRQLPDRNTAWRLQRTALKSGRPLHALRLLLHQITFRASVYISKREGASGYCRNWWNAVNEVLARGSFVATILPVLSCPAVWRRSFCQIPKKGLLGWRTELNTLANCLLQIPSHLLFRSLKRPSLTWFSGPSWPGMNPSSLIFHCKPHMLCGCSVTLSHIPGPKLSI